MRKVIILTLVLLTMATFSQAQFMMSLDFVYENTGFSASSGGCYNFVTDHYYVNDYDDPVAYCEILNNDGTPTGSSLDVGTVTFGGLGLWTVTVTTDGVIYGGSDYDPPGRLYCWANEAATPTEQDITGLAFARVMACKGTGADTIIASGGGGDDGPVDIMTTSDGVNFILSETTAALPGFKQGMDITEDGLTLYVGQGYFGNVPIKYDKIASVWTEDTAFAPSDTDVISPCPMGYWDERDVLFCLDTINTTGDNLTALDGSTGQVLGQVAVGYDVGPYGYGDIQLDAPGATGEGRFICRMSTGYLAGKFVFARPTPAPITAADSVWGLYE